MDKTRQALKQALEALDCIYSPLHVREINKVGAAMAAIREALAEQPAPKWQGARFDSALHEQPAPVAEPHKQQEPMAWIERDMQCDDYDPDSVTCQKPDIAADGWEWVPLYTSPQPAQPSKPWVGLTDEEVDECYYWKGRQWTTDELVRHVEAKLREKNNG